MSTNVTTEKDDKLLQAWHIRCSMLPSNEPVAVYVHGGNLYCVHRYSYIVKPASDEDLEKYEAGKVYAYETGRPIKQIRDVTKADPAVSHSRDGIDITGQLFYMRNKTLIFTQKGQFAPGTAGMLVLKEGQQYGVIERWQELSLSSSMLLLPLRPYRFHSSHINGGMDDCKLELRVYLPIPAPILTVTADTVTAVYMMDANFVTDSPQGYPPMLWNKKYYQLDGWKAVKDGPGVSTFSRLVKLKGKDIIQMKLPSPVNAGAASEQPTPPPAKGTIAPLPTPRKPKLPPPSPAPAPAPAPAAEDPQVESFDAPVNATEQPVEYEPKGETDRNGYTAPAVQQDGSGGQPESDSPAEPKKRTRTKAPTKQVGFDFTAVQEYLGSSIDPATADADAALQEIKTLRDIGILAFRRMANLTNVVKDASSASDTKLKQLAALLNSK